MHLDPIDSFTIVIFLLKLLDGVFVGAHNHMAVHADIKTGDSRMLGHFNLCVTVNTSHFVLPAVKSVGKGNGLIGLVTFIVANRTPLTANTRQEE